MKENILSQEEINKIQKSVDIVDVISGYLPLTSKGKNFFGVCPFHSDHSPSMSVSREKQIYKCFSCGATGNVFNFVMDYENINFIDAVKMIATKAGIPINISSNKNIDNDKNQVLYDIFDVSSKFYKNNINTKLGINAVKFINDRKFDTSIIKDFGLGLATNNYDSLTNFLIKKGFSQKDMLRTGLVMKNEKGLKDTYINRIMFPIHDLSGKLVGYSGRIFNGEKNTSKYFNIKETEIFKKGELLYNYYKAKKTAKEKEQIIIVEGFFATIRLHTIGIDNVVATLGTAFTKNHALIIKRMAKEVILCFDGDQAGNEATNSCIKELSKVGVTPKIIRLEDNLDPDDYVLKYGKDKMLYKINNPLNVMDYKLNYHLSNKDLTNNQDLSIYVNEMLDEINNIDDDIYKELTLKKLADISNINIDILKSKLNKDEKTIHKEENKIQLKLNKYEIAERNLMYYMLNSKEAVRLFNIEQPKLSKDEYIYLAENIQNYLKEYGNIEISILLTYFRNDSKIIKTINELLKLNLKEKCSKQELIDYIKLLKDKNFNKKINTINDNYKNKNTLQEKQKLLDQVLELRMKKIEMEKQND